MTADEFDSLNSTTTKRVCNCLPTCTSITYDYEISQAMMNWKKITVDGIKHDVQLSKLSIHYKNKKVIALRRSEFYGEIGFLSDCGGLLGLFMGFSLLSIVELFYYSTIRMFCNYLMRNRVRKEPELINVLESKNRKLNTIY